MLILGVSAKSFTASPNLIEQLMAQLLGIGGHTDLILPSQTK